MIKTKPKILKGIGQQIVDRLLFGGQVSVDAKAKFLPDRYWWKGRLYNKKDLNKLNICQEEFIITNPF